MDVVAESVAEVFAQRKLLEGLRFTYEPELLRFFQARFETVAAPAPPRHESTDAEQRVAFHRLTTANLAHLLP